MSLSLLTKFSRVRVALLAVLVLGGWASVALASGGTGTCPPGSSGGPYCQLIPTSLYAGPVIPAGITATLTRSDTGAPLPGQTLTFTAGGTTLCVATTNSAGSASCTSLLAVLTALLNLGYTVTYQGTSVYAPSTAHGSAIDLAQLLAGLGLSADGHATHGASAQSNAALIARLQAIGSKRLMSELKVLRTHERRTHHARKTHRARHTHHLRTA